MLETMKQIDSQLMMRNYEGFLSLSVTAPASAPRAARQARCRQGNAGRAPRRALRRRAPLDRRHLPRRRRRWAPRSGSRPSATWTRGELVPDEIVVGVVEECLAPGGPLDDGFVLDGFPRTLPRPRSSTGCSTAARSTSRSTSTCPREIVLDRHRRPAGLRELPARVPREHAADGRLDLRHVRRRRSCSATTTPRRRSTAGSSSTSSETVPIIDYYRDHGNAGRGRRRRRRRRGVRAPRQGRSTSASERTGRRWSLAKTPPQIALDAPGRQVVAEMHEACIRGGQARRDHRRPRRRGPRGARAAGRPLELPRLPRLPRGGVHLAQRGDRARHPRATGCSRRATSSRSTAGRSSRAGTPTPRSRSRSATIDDESQRLIDVTRRVARGRDRRRSWTGNRLGDIGAAVEGVAERRGLRGGAGVRRPRHRHRDARGPAGPQLRAAGPGAAAARTGMVLAIEPMVNAGQRRRPGCSTTAGPSSPPTARRSAHFEHTVAVTDHGPEVLTAALVAAPQRLRRAARFRLLTGPARMLVRSALKPVLRAVCPRARQLRR